MSNPEIEDWNNLIQKKVKTKDDGIINYKSSILYQYLFRVKAQ
jgi:hypothetical protein